MKTIFLCSMKGGSGKSLIACNLAAMFARNGKKTLLIDADLPQQTTTDWFAQWSTRGESSPLHLARAENANKLSKNLRLAQSAGFDYIVLDSSGKLSDIHDIAFDVSDLVIMPIRPNVAELRANSDLLAELKMSGVQHRIIFNQYRATKRHKETIDLLQKQNDPELFSTILPISTAFETTMDDGICAADSKNNAINHIMESFYIEMNDLLGNQ